MCVCMCICACVLVVSLLNLHREKAVCVFLKYFTRCFTTQPSSFTYFHTASKIMDLPSPSLSEAKELAIAHIARVVVSSPEHSLNQLFKWLPSGRKNRVLDWKEKAHFKISFVPSALIALNMKNLFLYVDFSSLYIVHVMFISDMFFCGIRGKRVYLLSVVSVGIFFIFYLCATVLFLNVCCPDTNLTWLCENKYPFSWVYRACHIWNILAHKLFIQHW